MTSRDRRVSMLITYATTAALLGHRACVDAECGNEEMAYQAARMSWKWATWAADEADVLSNELTTAQLASRWVAR